MTIKIANIAWTSRFERFSWKMHTHTQATAKRQHLLCSHATTAAHCWLSCIWMIELRTIRGWRCWCVKQNSDSEHFHNFANRFVGWCNDNTTAKLGVQVYGIVYVPTDKKKWFSSLAPPYSVFRIRIEVYDGCYPGSQNKVNNLYRSSFVRFKKLKPLGFSVLKALCSLKTI